MAYADYMHCPACDGKTIYMGDSEDPDGVEAWHSACLEPLIGHKNPPEADDSCPDYGRPVKRDLTEDRAWFVYEAARIAATAARAPIVPERWARREPAFRAQFREVIVRQCRPVPELRWVAERALRYISEHMPSEDLEHDLRAALGRSPEELHDDWVKAYEAMGWVYGPERDAVAKTHPDMVPYEKLGQLERDKDSVFVALCEIARQWIRETP